MFTNVVCNPIHLKIVQTLHTFSDMYIEFFFSGNYNLFVKLSFDTFLSKPKVQCRPWHASQLRLSHVYNFQILNSTSQIRIFKTLDATVKTSGQLVRSRDDNFRSKKSKERI